MALPASLYQKCRGQWCNWQQRLVPGETVSTFIPSPQPARCDFDVGNQTRRRCNQWSEKKPNQATIGSKILRARLSLIVTIRQTFNCAPRSSRIEIRITNPKLVKSSWVKTDVWVRNPGPIAEVAIRKAAPNIALLPATPGEEVFSFFK